MTQNKKEEGEKLNEVGVKGEIKPEEDPIKNEGEEASKEKAQVKQEIKVVKATTAHSNLKSMFN